MEESEGGGDPAEGEPSTSAEARSLTFKYQHPSTNYSVELSVADAGAAECPGCGDPKKQLVRHLKSDPSCKKRCEKIDLESFDKQLKAFRNRERVKASRQQSRGEDLEGFLEKQRGQQQARKGRRKAEDEEGFLGKKRVQEQARKGQRRAENEEGFLKKQRDQQQARKGRRKTEDEEGFLGKKRVQEKARKGRRKAEDEEGFLEKQRHQQQARKEQRRAENEEGFLKKQRDQQQARKGKRKAEDEEGFQAKHRKEERIRRSGRLLKQRGAIGRARRFSRAIMLADIFICSCCERRLFEQNVVALGDLKEKVETKKAGLFTRCIPVLKDKALVSFTINGKATENHYICHACKGHLLKGKMPPMCAQNGLKKEPISDDNLKLTELERNMIALRIPFTKMVMLKKSRYI